MAMVWLRDDLVRVANGRYCSIDEKKIKEYRTYRVSVNIKYGADIGFRIGENVNNNAKLRIYITSRPESRRMLHGRGFDLHLRALRGAIPIGHHECMGLHYLQTWANSRRL